VGGGIGESSSHLALIETISLVVALIFALIVAARVGFVKAPKLSKVAYVGTWFIFAYFTLNIVGNLASSSPVEKMVFTPISIVLVLLTFRVAIEG
jgi:hypothetical protein